MAGNGQSGSRGDATRSLAVNLRRLTAFNALQMALFGPDFDASWWRARWTARPLVQWTDAKECLFERDSIVDRIGEITCPAITFHGDLDMGIDLLPKLRDLGAKSVDDLQYLEPDDFDDLDLSLVKKRKLATAVIDVKSHLARGHRLRVGGEKGGCAVS